MVFSFIIQQKLIGQQVIMIMIIIIPGHREGLDRLAYFVTNHHDLKILYSKDSHILSFFGNRFQIFLLIGRKMGPLEKDVWK